MRDDTKKRVGADEVVETEPQEPEEVVVAQHGEGTMLVDGCTVQFTRDAWERLFKFIDVFPVEIQGFGRVRVVSPGVYRITEVFLVDQDAVSAAHAVATDGFAKFCTQEMIADRPIEDIRFWWHSHVRMSTEWSSTDIDTMASFMHSGWLIAFVGNKRGECRIRFQCFDPPLAIDNVAAHIVLPTGEADANDIVRVGKRVEVFRRAPRSGMHLDGVVQEIATRVRGASRRSYQKYIKSGGGDDTTADARMDEFDDQDMRYVQRWRGHGKR